MAALSGTTFLRIYHRVLPVFINATRSKPVIATSKYKKCILHHKLANDKVSVCGLLSVRQHSTSFSASQDELDQNDLIKDFEVSHEEFKYVEQILPSPTVPELEEQTQYPTPSGWFPPDEATQAQQKYLIRRTKNHMLPVYSHTQNTWFGTSHFVSIKKIEGDIWALEADLREHVLKTTGQKSVNTHVHEVGRFIRVRGQHRDLIAKFLLEKGM
ncbi:hypothetical protein EGW08_004407 [Elysia chlorotica]|uniref:Large ribosomal subunit protein mL49 n=1 Tax=Elysia chlorotica TaxID=188477 RepID=A0A3S1CAY9_ELYCH|nr:hypothetical protein EGW08_004407 [Elysia chlorotica]